ncbi:MAG: HlyD family secretion protein [Nitrospiraceae bacterium]|nr:MAG: HlyD family secretion protein [Nitrospiraceae bacterium]
MKKRITVLFIIVLLIAITLIFYSHFTDKQLRQIVTTGTVEGTEVNLAPKIPGRISEICCQVGDEVQKGSVVIKLESDEIMAEGAQASASLEKAQKDINSASALIGSSKAEIRAAEADIKNAEAETEKARVLMDEAKLQMDRVTSLFSENLIPKADNDRAVAAFESMKAAYEGSKAQYNAMLARRELAASQLYYSQSQLESAKARVKEAEAAVSVQKARFDDTVIKSPVSGTVVYRAIEPGEYVSPGITTATIVDMKNLWVRIDVEESLIQHITLGNMARIEVEGMRGKEISGSISEVGRYAEFATQKDVQHGVQDLKTFRVKIRIDDTGNILKPGMTVNVEIPVKNSNL